MNWAPVQRTNLSIIHAVWVKEHANSHEAICGVRPTRQGWLGVKAELPTCRRCQSIAGRANIAIETRPKANATLLLTREIVDIICPTHGRTSCDDKRRGNGLHSADYGPRCNRCSLLEIVDEYNGEMPPGFVLRTIVEREVF